MIFCKELACKSSLHNHRNTPLMNGGLELRLRLRVSLEKGSTPSSSLVNGQFGDIAEENFFVDGIVDHRGIISDQNTIAISWVFSIVEELVKYSHGRIIQCDASAYSTGFRVRDVHVMVDQSKEPVILPPITHAEHFSVIIYPIEAFHSNRVIGVTGIARYDQPQGIDYCIRIVDDLKRNENTVEVVSSGWIYGEEQYALDIVLTHPNTEIRELLPGRSRCWNFHSRCKLRRRPLLIRMRH